MSERPVVLVVEDESLLRLAAVDLVESAGLDVVEAANATEAVRILESRLDVRIVFSDIDMPAGVDGVKLAAIIRDRWPPIEIILVSGYVEPPQVDLPARTVFYFKPYKDAEIVAQMRKFLDKTTGPDRRDLVGPDMRALRQPGRCSVTEEGARRCQLAQAARRASMQETQRQSARGVEDSEVGRRAAKERGDSLACQCFRQHAWAWDAVESEDPIGTDDNPGASFRRLRLHSHQRRPASAAPRPAGLRRPSPPPPQVLAPASGSAPMDFCLRCANTRWPARLIP